MKMQIYVLIKHVMQSIPCKANAMDSQGAMLRYDDYKAELKDVVHLVNNNYDWAGYRDQGNWKNKEGYKNYRNGNYVPPHNIDQGEPSGSRLEEIMA